LKRQFGSLFVLAISAACVVAQQPPMQVGFLWHMHQPIYYPGENINQTSASNRYSFSVTDVHNQRFGPYTTWPKDAIQAGSGMPHLGAQVSFSGSLIENLNDLEAAGVNGGMWNNWDAGYDQARTWNTAEGNPRLDMVGFGYHHPLMPLLDERDIRMQIKLHKHVTAQTFGGSYSKGIFPAETAFSTRMIPALKAEGLDWAIVDNIHFDRATQNYPYTPASNLAPPNRADQINPDPAANGGAWIQLQKLWAPSKVSAPFSYRPHNVQHVNPNTGEITKIVAVPAARYEGNEDGRGGYGAFLYDRVMDAYQPYNTDPNHPLFTLLHHDGDNFGGGSEAYYHSNFQNMVNWANSDPDYDVTTIQDYLERFPVNPNDVIHVEPGSWAGADNGDPEFKKWLGDPNASGWSPDRNSWAVLTAAKNRVFTADDLSPATNLQNVIDLTGSATERAWGYLLQAQASDHWYWDGTEVWDSNVTRGSNLAVQQANQVIASLGANEATPPTVFLPQREIYNPGGIEFGTTVQPSDFQVWTFAYDVSGMQSVNLKYRVDADGFNPLNSVQNETYAGGAEVGSWVTVPMISSDVAPPAGILAPTYRAPRYGGMITGQQNALLDYYVEAIDSRGNVTRTDIQQVWVGSSIINPGGSVVEITPDPPVAGQMLSLTYDPTGRNLANATIVYAHYGYNNWATVAPDTAMTWNATEGLWTLSVPVASNATKFDVVFNNGAGVWDNNGGADWRFTVTNPNPPTEFVMDGALDAGANLAATVAGRSLHWQRDGNRLYVATSDAGEGSDVFLYLADQPGALQAANWAKAGQIASWNAFLADENSNDYEGWFDAPAGSQAASGSGTGVLEGVIDLVAEFGAVPEFIYLAVGLFGNSDGGALAGQIPAAAVANGNLEAGEYLRIRLAPIPGDYDGNGTVQPNDYVVWRDNFGATGPNNADGNGDGKVDAADFNLWRDNLGMSAFSITGAAVPEPATLAVVVLATLGLAFREMHAGRFRSW
jgi:hypothetical protein